MRVRCSWPPALAAALGSDVVPAFDSLSGEIHAAHRALLQNRFLHEGIDRHLDGATMAAEIAPGARVGRRQRWPA